jgi:hypothetical protein
VTNVSDEEKQLERDLADLAMIDPEMHKSLVWMLENNITGIQERFRLFHD